jgi:hypothetical protein
MSKHPSSIISQYCSAQNHRVISGAIATAAHTTVYGKFLSLAAISVGAYATVEGGLYSTAGAVAVGANGKLKGISLSSLTVTQVYLSPSYSFSHSLF